MGKEFYTPLSRSGMPTKPVRPARLQAPVQPLSTALPCRTSSLQGFWAKMCGSGVRHGLPVLSSAPPHRSGSGRQTGRRRSRSRWSAPWTRCRCCGRPAAAPSSQCRSCWPCSTCGRRAVAGARHMARIAAARSCARWHTLPRHFHVLGVARRSCVQRARLKSQHRRSPPSTTSHRLCVGPLHLILRVSPEHRA